MSNWWKNPLLQGPENDYGDYDYLATELPENTAKWEWGDYRCDSCGKYHRRNFRTVGYFYTLDGYDSMDYNECWVCIFKRKVYSIKRKVTKRVKAFFEATKWCVKAKSFRNFKLIYKITIK